MPKKKPHFSDETLASIQELGVVLQSIRIRLIREGKLPVELEGTNIGKKDDERPARLSVRGRRKAGGATLGTTHTI
ncbi:MAG TPA: hypothetical protein VGO67_02160 [Verrucomicrobiae bacterium]